MTTTTGTSDWVLTTIPFSGFYETVHNMGIADATRAFLEDADGDAYDDLVDAADNLPCDYRTIHTQYARAYANALCTSIGIAPEHWAFDDLSSPREYNFSTDRIFIKLHPDAFANIVRDIHSSPDGIDIFRARCAANFISCDGFLSYYDADYTTWGAPIEWDHNQLGVLLEVHCCAKLAWGDDCAGQYEYEQHFASELNNNRVLDNMIYVGYQKTSAENYDAWLGLILEADDRRQKELGW
jgi:hypothetical protein